MNHHEIKIPNVSINKNWDEKDEQTTETSFSGVGILSKDDFKGFIKADAARGLEWLSNETKRGEVTIKLENDERDYLTADIEKFNVKVTPIVKNTQVNFNIDIDFNAVINGFKGEISTDEIRKGVTEQNM